jgi:hypothetical protein
LGLQKGTKGITSQHQQETVASDLEKILQ